MNGIVLDKSGFSGSLTVRDYYKFSCHWNTERCRSTRFIQSGQNYPNPFNPSTMISFTNTQLGFVTLKLFDILGREVKVIYKGEMAAGTHAINFNAGKLASGNYIYTLQVNDQFACRKMTLLK